MAQTQCFVTLSSQQPVVEAVKDLQVNPGCSSAAIRLSTLVPGKPLGQGKIRVKPGVWGRVIIKRINHRTTMFQHRESYIQVGSYFYRISTPLPH